MKMREQMKSSDPHVRENIGMRSTFVTTVCRHQNVLLVKCDRFSLICLFFSIAELFSYMDGITRQTYSMWMH